jgi:NitT/TauT family transport system permease protein
MKYILKIIKDFPSYLWSGWGHQIYGDLILPAPLDTFETLLTIVSDSQMQNEIKTTLYRASKVYHNLPRKF